MSQLAELIEISRFYGDKPDYVIAGGGNTSCKDRETIWIKASGIPLAGIDENGFVSLDRKLLAGIETASYSGDQARREEEVKEDMKRAIIAPENLRPSVETSLHNLIACTFVVHTHPTLVNALMCSRNVRAEVEKRFGNMALLVEYTDPGYILFKKVQERIASYEAEQGKAPQIIFLQNHGVFVGADTLEEIKSLYQEINQRIAAGKDLSLPSDESVDVQNPVSVALESYSKTRSLFCRTFSSDLISHFTRDWSMMKKVSRPFSPDIIVYCKSNYLFLKKEQGPGAVAGAMEDFETTQGYYPKVILQEGGGLTVVEENKKSLQTVSEVYLDLMKISYLSEQFGGPHFMTPEQIRFIDNWEVEHYRRKIAKEEKG